LIQLTQLGAVNCYLIREEDGFILIDTSPRGAHRFIVEFAVQANSKIKRIVLTHAHYDHVGSLDALRTKLAAVQLIISARERRLFQGDFSLDAKEAQSRIQSTSFPLREAKVDRAVEEGDLIGSLRVIAAPGHTPGQIALFDSRNSALIVADAFSSMFGLTVAGHPNVLFPFPARCTWDAKTALASAEKLTKLEPYYLARGHGAVLKEPGMMMQRAIRKAFKVAA
jgi:glyoxylase-like metal-dependent hydrolase (beta-lactamase superfamily II)